jgi:hypothetical protein
MKPSANYLISRSRLTGLLFLTALILAACAPAGLPVTELPASTQLPPAAQTETTGSGVGQSTPMSQVTPRGPNLVASDPQSVNLASGGLQLVEFFRFT